MIFGDEMADKVLAGLKTETRRRGRGDEPCRYVPGRDYAVQRGRGMHSEGRIRVVSVHRETLGQMLHWKAVREGFSGVGEFMRYWESLHGGYVHDEHVWVIRFVLAEPRAKRKKGGAKILALGSGAL